MARTTGSYSLRDVPPTPAGLLRECELSLYRASGPGGQHRNKVETAVRLRHLPTGMIVTAADSRSQARNRTVALERLRERLIGRLTPKKTRVPTSTTARARAERVEEKKLRARVKASRRRVEPESA